MPISCRWRIFLTRTLALFRDPDVGLVQTPQHFVNPDPIQANLSACDVWPDEQRYFFDVVMPSKDAWGAAFCCGTSSVIRYPAADADRRLSDRLRHRGLSGDAAAEGARYRTVYLNEKLSLGLAPEGLKEYVTQRARWCLGFMQICRGPSGPFRRHNGLPLLHRLGLIEFFSLLVGKLCIPVLVPIVPILYRLFGINSVHAQVWDAVGHFLPFFVAQILVTGWLASGRTMPILAEVASFWWRPKSCAPARRACSSRRARNSTSPPRAESATSSYTSGRSCSGSPSCSD